MRIYTRRANHRPANQNPVSLRKTKAKTQMTTYDINYYYEGGRRAAEMDMGTTVKWEHDPLRMMRREGEVTYALLVSQWDGEQTRVAPSGEILAQFPWEEMVSGQPPKRSYQQEIYDGLV